MLEVKVTVECKDLSQAITQLALAVKGAAVMAPAGDELVIPAGTPAEVQSAVPVAPQPAAPAPAPAPAPVAPMPQPQAAVPAMNPPVQPAEPAPAAVQKIDMASISRAGAGLIDQGKMQDVLAVLAKYGVQVITQLREEQFEAFAADLRALGAAI